MQPDQSIFTIDNNYQRFAYELPIEETFRRTVSVFHDSGYRLDVADRATGQISGRRGPTGDKGLSAIADLKVYAVVLPRGRGSELGLKIVQVMKSGPLNSSKAEITVNDKQLYQFTFQRIANLETE
ncbi:MAG: hypothetical protein WCO11_08225 [Sphingomonadales bacterium]